MTVSPARKAHAKEATNNIPQTPNNKQSKEQQEQQTIHELVQALQDTANAVNKLTKYLAEPEMRKLLSDVIAQGNTITEAIVASTKQSTRKRKVEKDPDAPKKPGNPYSAFVAANHAIQQSAHPEVDHKNMMSHLASIWREMTKEEKEPYMQQGKTMAEDYKRKFDEYQNKKARASEEEEQDNEHEQEQDHEQEEEEEEIDLVDEQLAGADDVSVEMAGDTSHVHVHDIPTDGFEGIGTFSDEERVRKEQLKREKKERKRREKEAARMREHQAAAN